MTPGASNTVSEGGQNQTPIRGQYLTPIDSETVPEPLGAVFTLEEATIADINAAFDAGAVSCERLVQLYLDRIAEYDDAGPQLNSIITVNPQALNAARALDAERASGGPRSRLHCIPVLLKDNIDTDDMPTSNGSVMLKDAMAADDAYVTRALREAGALILGKASLGEFAGGNSYNSVDGQTRNPYHLQRTAGGSSSGSAVAVAANLAAMAIGDRGRVSQDLRNRGGRVAAAGRGVGAQSAPPGRGDLH